MLLDALGTNARFQFIAFKAVDDEHSLKSAGQVKGRENVGRLAKHERLNRDQQSSAHI